MKPLKVYGWPTHLYAEEGEALGLVRHASQVRAVVAARSLAEFLRITGLSRYYAKDYVAETGNERDVALALAHPGRVILRVDIPAHRIDPTAPEYIIREEKS